MCSFHFHLPQTFSLKQHFSTNITPASFHPGNSASTLINRTFMMPFMNASSQIELPHQLKNMDDLENSLAFANEAPWKNKCHYNTICKSSLLTQHDFSDSSAVNRRFALYIYACLLSHSFEHIQPQNIHSYLSPA
jgi:hypothetical protein